MRKLPVRYCDDTGCIDYVSRTPPELATELERVQKSRLDAIRILSRVRRVRHPAVLSAKFQLLVCGGGKAETPTDKATELARLSRAMELACQTLGRLRNSRVQWLEEARFVLTYGTASKQRERATGFGKKRYYQDEEQYGDDKMDA